jgi:GNAT superfamily N-acetyltransferase
MPLGRTPSGRVRTLEHEDAPTCDAIIASLPEWFGMPEGIRDCARDVRVQSGLAFEREDHVIGFLTYVARSATMTEITWMAVHAHDRGRGIGTALVTELVERLSAAGVRKLLVKTLSDRVDPGPEYAATRRFYLARGFVPAAELDLYPDNPIQLMSRRI